MIVWCMLFITLNCSSPEFGVCEGNTAVRGKVIKTEPDFYFVDFSEYAKKQKYLGDWSAPRLVEKDTCVKD